MCRSLRVEVLEGLEEAYGRDGAGELVDGRQRRRLAPQGVHLAAAKGAREIYSEVRGPA